MIELNPREVNAMGDGAMREQMIDLIDQLAREWDACEFDGGGGCVIDIGDAVRTAGFRRVHALFAASPVAADTMGDAPPLSDDQIKAIAQQWFTTGENQLRADGYYYRSLGTVTNVRESDLIAFAREVLSRAAAWPALREAIANAPTIRAAITEGTPDA